MSSPVSARAPLQILVVLSPGNRLDHQNECEQLGVPAEWSVIYDPDFVEDELHRRAYDLVLWRISRERQKLPELQRLLHWTHPLPPLVVIAPCENRGSSATEELLELVGHSLRDFCFDDEPEILIRAIRRILAEQTERRAMDRFRQLLESAPDAIIEVDADGTIVLLNGITEQLFGYSQEELLGQSVERLVPDELRERHARHRAKYAANPVTRPMGSGLDLYGRRKDGTRFPVEISLSPVKSAEGSRVSVIIRDVSERKKAEEQIREMQDRYTAQLAGANRKLEARNVEVERANRLKSEFLASMSHELRTPLHTITGFAQLLAEEVAGELNAKQKRFVDHIHRDSLHLLDLINGILDISKIEAGKLELHPENFNGIDALGEVISSIAPLAAAKAISLEQQASTVFTIHADRLRFKQILYNLLSNAVKFTPHGGKVSIVCSTTGAWVEVSVTDTGVGIPKEEQAAIFDKFYQVGSTTRGVPEGTGLGLAITKRLVELHGGRLWLASEPGAGSCFSFTLPF